MKTKAEAVKTLLAAGWTESEINQVFAATLPYKPDYQRDGSPAWWQFLDEDDLYLNGSPLVVGWVGSVN